MPILRRLFNEVADPGALNSIQIQEILSLAGEALNRVQPGFFEIFREEDAVAYFYEPFLEAFDPQLRKELGVWYTPREIVDYMVERVDRLLRTELHQPLGLASPAVRILDPCCGTGAYLTAVLQRIHRTLLEEAGDDTALVASQVRNAALTRVFGFEIMPAPFVIAHLQVAALLEQAGAGLSGNHRAGVYLTNALTGWVPAQYPNTMFAEFRQERELKLAYRETVPGIPAPQGQGLNDLYVRFFRIAERRIVGDVQVSGNSDGCGIVCFISNNAWLDGLSHTTMRARYLNTFQSIYVDNLNGDKYRTGKTTPDGKPDPSAFSTAQNREGIQVGTAIATLVRTTPTRSKAQVQLRDLWGIGKLDQLARESHHGEEPAYTQLAPVPALGNPLANRIYTAAYTSWPRVHQLFPTTFPGVKTSRDSLVVDIDRERLEARLVRYFQRTTSDSEIESLVPGAMENSATFDPIQTRRFLQEKGFRPWQVIPYVYRPFDVRWLYWEPETSLIDRSRVEFLEQVTQSRLWIEIRQREASDTFCRGTVSRSLSDQFGNGMSHFVPDTVFLEGSLYNTRGAEHLNLSATAKEIAAARDMEERGIFFHALTALHTPIYRSENAGALLGDWPRIPLPATADLLIHSAQLGRRLAELLDAESPVNLSGEWSFLGALKLPLDADPDTSLKITAGWGHKGQGATVMPGRGLYKEREWTETELAKIAALAAAQSLAIEDVLKLLGPTCVDVYLNGDAWWAAVPVNVWEYTLGGYQVLKKWLSYREFPLLGRALKPEESAWFAQVVRRIAAILLMGPALDASYKAILPGATGLPQS